MRKVTGVLQITQKPDGTYSSVWQGSDRFAVLSVTGGFTPMPGLNEIDGIKFRIAAGMPAKETYRHIYIVIKESLYARLYEKWFNLINHLSLYFTPRFDYCITNLKNRLSGCQETGGTPRYSTTSLLAKYWMNRFTVI